MKPLDSPIKIISLIDSLSAWEKTRFQKYILSPYFNTDLKLAKLLEILYQTSEENQIDRKKLDHSLHLNQPFNYDRITNLLSYLTRHLENFLAQERLKKDPFLIRYQTFCEARERGLKPLFNQINREFSKTEAKRDYWSSENFYHQHLIENERSTFFLEQKKRTSHESFGQSIAYLERFYFLAMLKAVCQFINLRNVVQTQSEETNINDFLSTIRARHQQFENDPLIKIYYRVLMSLVEVEDVSHYFRLKSGLEEVKTSIIPIERQTIYQYGLNYCIKKANSGQTEFLEELFDLYQAMIQEELIFQDGFILHHDVKNIVSLGVRLKKFEWIEAFMQEVSDKITPEHRNNSLNYNLAYLYHGKGELRKALRLLREVELQDIYYAFGARTLLMKIYFELNEQEALDALIHSFRNYLTRNKLASAYQRKIHLNLLKFVGRLNKLRIAKITMTPYAYKEKTQRLHNRIMTTKEITNIGWLLGQLEELANN